MGAQAARRDIFALSYLDEYRQCRINKDLATLRDERHFIRGVLPIPFIHQEGYFGWGIWVEISKSNHDLYLEHFYIEASHLPRFRGRIANSVSAYDETMGLEVEVQLGNNKQRPTFYMLDSSGHQLSREQVQGIDAARHHEILQACGHFDEDDS